MIAQRSYLVLRFKRRPCICDQHLEKNSAAEREIPRIYQPDYLQPSTWVFI